VEPTVRSELGSPLRWTVRSTRVLAHTLQDQGHTVSLSTVAESLNEAGLSLQANRKMREYESHPDRNAQFEYIHRLVKRLQGRGQPVIWDETKTKELVGDS